jgi:hypothetical protein
MSISALIQNPQNEEEQSFSVPVASERIFEKRWTPIIEELQLEWLPLFSTGVDLEKIDLDDILSELNLFKASYIEKFGADQVVDRVNLLSDSLQKVFYRDDVKVFIG